MMKFLLDVLQIVILIKLSYSVVKWVLGVRKSKRKSIASKIVKLLSNRIHYQLDNALKKQKQTLRPTHGFVKPTNAKVIPLRKTK